MTFDESIAKTICDFDYANFSYAEFPSNRLSIHIIPRILMIYLLAIDKVVGFDVWLICCGYKSIYHNIAHRYGNMDFIFIQFFIAKIEFENGNI